MSDEEIKQQQNDQFIRLLHLSDKLFLSIIVSAIAISSTVVWQGSKIYSKIEADEVSIVELNDDKKIKTAQIVILQQADAVIGTELHELTNRVTATEKVYFNTK